MRKEMSGRVGTCIDGWAGTWRNEVVNGGTVKGRFGSAVGTEVGEWTGRWRDG